MISNSANAESCVKWKVKLNNITTDDTMHISEAVRLPFSFLQPNIYEYEYIYIKFYYRLKGPRFDSYFPLINPNTTKLVEMWNFLVC